MKRIASICALLLSGGVVGCNNDRPMGGVDAGSDSGVMALDSGPVPDVPAVTCEATIPTAPFGVLEGRKFEPITLTRCDGTAYEFYNQDYCEARLTVVSIAAGWCGPCIIESGMLTEQITDVYGPQGVRVIQVITQTEDYGAPDGAYCDGWVTRFGLTNIELIDPAQDTSVYFPGNALPASLIVDNEGIIRFREYGVSDELRTLRAELDDLLAEM
jgi:hypothetical protein